MTTSNEHNNAPAVPQGWPLGELSNGQIIATVVRMGELVNYLKLGQQWAGICNLVRQIIRERYTLAATPAHAPSKGAVGFGARALAAELAEAALKDDNDPEGHDISAGLFGPNVSAWLRKVASEYLAPAHAPAQERCSTCGYLTSEREHLGCLRRAVKDLDIATGGPYDAQEVGLTDEMIAAGGRALCDISADACNVDRDDNWALHSEFYKSDAHACIIAALRAKGEK